MNRENNNTNNNQQNGYNNQNNENYNNYDNQYYNGEFNNYDQNYNDEFGQNYDYNNEFNNYDNQNYNGEYNQNYNEQYNNTDYNENINTQNINQTPNTNYQNYNNHEQNNVPPINTNYDEEPKEEKKKSIFPVILTAIVTFVVLVGAMYFGYNKFIKKENIADISTYEVNFVTFGAEGEGKPEVDIKKVPTVSNQTSEISNLLSNPDISFDKQSGLKNGDKVEVTITINKNTAEKLNLKTTGEFKRTFTVNGLNEKAKDKETIIVREGSNSNSNSTFSGNPTARAESKRIYVDAGVNLRSEPTDSSTILATAKKGDTVHVEYTQKTSNGETWAYLSYNGKYGWMRADLVGY